MLTRSANTYRIKQHWFVEANSHRFWLSPMAELLLTAYWNDSNIATDNIMGQINQYFHYHRIIPSRFALRFIDIRAMLRKMNLFWRLARSSTLFARSSTNNIVIAIIAFSAIDRATGSSHCGWQYTTSYDDSTESGLLSACSSTAEQLRKKHPHCKWKWQLLSK